MGIDIVSGCQLKCIGCPNSTIEKKIEFMSLQTLRTCLENIDVKVNLLRLFNFGEVILHPHFVEMVRLVNEWGGYKKLEISTNGQIWSKVTDLLKVDVDRVVVSCDGNSGRESYEWIRRGATWDQLMKCLDVLENSLPKNKRLIRCITTKRYQDKWRKLLPNWDISFREWIPMPRSRSNPSQRTDFKSKGSCEHVDTDNLYVDYDGVVGPCCNYPNAFYIGNLTTEKVSYLIKRKRELREKMEGKRWGVCRECVL